MDFYKRAVELKNELIDNRRYFHKNAETGLHMPRATAYVLEKLTEYGIEAARCGEGITATLGTGGKVILLRADMDALPMKEESGLPFACPTGSEAHTCGHDLHAAMLLTAAKLLKEQEESLNGTVKLMFQPAEETLEGCRNMIDSGLFDPPVPDAALAFHVGPGKSPVGLYLYNDSGEALMYSTDTFRITVHGKGAHGAYPQMSVDPINIGVHIHLTLQELIAREIAPTADCVLTVGAFNSGSAPNIIPETAALSGMLRANEQAEREKLLRRIRDISEKTAAVYGGSASVEISGSIPPLICDAALTKQIAGYMGELSAPGLAGHSGITASASEDFALIASRIPSVMMYLTAGFADERGDAPAHSPQVQFNEDVLPFGAAAYAHCAMRWLSENA